VARAADRRLNFDELHFIPAEQASAQAEQHLAPFPHRFAMVALACTEHPHLCRRWQRREKTLAARNCTIGGYGALFPAHVPWHGTHLFPLLARTRFWIFRCGKETKRCWAFATLSCEPAGHPRGGVAAEIPPSDGACGKRKEGEASAWSSVIGI